MHQPLSRCAAPLVADGLDRGRCGSAVKFGDAEGEVPVPHPVAGEAYLDQARSFQPVRHFQVADVQRARPEALNERLHARLGLRRCPRPGCAPSSRRPSKSTTLNTPHANTHTTTRKPSPRGSPKPHAKPAPPTLNSLANNWRCSSMAPRPAPGSSTPTPSPPPPPSPPSSSTTPSPPQPREVSAEVSGLLLCGWRVSDSPIRPRRPGRGRPR